MPGPVSPTVRRRELGALLRTLRTDRGWTVEYVAERLLVSPSKISRLETGQRGVSQRDIRDLCDLYEVDDGLRDHLTDLAAEGKQQAWWQSRRLYYSSYVGLEAEASSIRDFGLGVIPGLLQTPDYGRAVLHSTIPRLSDDVVEERLAGRLERQRLLRADGGPRFETIIDEAVLHRVAADARIMSDQLNHLLEMSERAKVVVRILPFSAGLLPSNTNKFIILDFDQAAVPTTVFIEHLTGDLYLDKSEDVTTYEATFAQMREMSADEDRTRQMIRSAAVSLGR